MNSLITIWGGIYVVGLSVFSLLVLYIIPAGYKDLRKLFRDLNETAEPEDGSDS